MITGTGSRPGKTRKVTKRGVIVTQMVNKSAEADLRTTKILLDKMKEVEQKAGMVAPSEPAKLTPADNELVERPSRDCGARSRPCARAGFLA